MNRQGPNLNTRRNFLKSPVDTVSDFHYMCMQSRRLRGASAEASYEVGRDAAPACVAYATTYPGGRRAASAGYYGSARVRPPYNAKAETMPRWRAEWRGRSRHERQGPAFRTRPNINRAALE